MLNFRCLSRIDFRLVPVVLGLMVASLLVISAQSQSLFGDEVWLTPLVKSQVQWFSIGACVFLFFTAFDYNKLREWTWILYLLVLLALVGLFFTDAIQRVHRWYKIPGIGINIQPSEYAKLVVVIALSWFLERRKTDSRSFSTAFFASLIVAVPFFLILKQPDLGSALVLFPLTLIMFYFGDVHPFIVKSLSYLGLSALIAIGAIFLQILPYEQVKPYASLVLKEYQFERLNPNTHHQNASATAISIGGMAGLGFGRGEYSRGGWLPAPTTDSVFPAFGEEFGLLGLSCILFLYYALIYFCFQVSLAAKDAFGRFLAAGIATYLAMHILVNIGMMCGFLPITGVPLVLMTYGGSSVISTMIALGILQSIYSRRFMF